MLFYKVRQKRKGKKKINKRKKEKKSGGRGRGGCGGFYGCFLVVMCPGLQAVKGLTVRGCWCCRCCRCSGIPSDVATGCPLSVFLRWCLSFFRSGIPFYYFFLFGSMYSVEAFSVSVAGVPLFGVRSVVVFYCLPLWSFFIRQKIKKPLQSVNG